MTNFDIYINFVMHAIYGRLGEADTLMRCMPEAIHDAAAWLAKRFPVEDKPIYRGLLLDPARGLERRPFTFLSWSEDRDVARWFANPESGISDFVRVTYPYYRGFIASMPAPASRVLFHHSWAKGFGDFQRYALMHPMIATEGARQILWSLSTQHEVITEPVDILKLTPIANVTGAALDELDRKLLPPWELQEGIAL